MIENGNNSSPAEKMPSSQGCRTSFAMAGVYHPVWDELLPSCMTQKEIQSLPMIVAIFFMRLFEIMFFLGIAGSAVVVVISFIEDLQLLVGE
jgi:hypothetical protein